MDTMSQFISNNLLRTSIVLTKSSMDKMTSPHSFVLETVSAIDTQLSKYSLPTYEVKVRQADYITLG
jgi:hypothetical protein